MAKIEFPKLLRQLLEESDLQAPIRGFADRVGEILVDNKLPFFPDYTDHGIDHINCVLRSEVELVPKQVWEGSKADSEPRLLRDADAAITIGATLLHDIAMHLRADGFRELISKESRFRPLPWFKDSQEGHSTDRPWPNLWTDYCREAGRFSDRVLANIIGIESVQHNWKFGGLPENVGEWELNHCLIIGEFIRRHHARLAHEIAIYGFPGLPVGGGEGQFPALGREEGHPLMRLADLIGLAARSHGLSLRTCKAYLNYQYAGTPRPMSSAVLFPMALLRVADYLQIDRQRAPAVLLQLRHPPSPISLQEWNKHLAVLNIGPATDPRGKMVTVNSDLPLKLYLQIRDLLSGLQAEMDHSTAVLDETYGTLSDLGMDRLNLATRRVYSNLQSPAFRDSLPYLPERTGFSADPNLLTLLVEPLYGKEPSVGVRELMQNAVDAVCELEAWCAAHELAVSSLELPEQDSDVLVEFVKGANGTWLLRVRDKGIGMRSETIQNYFFRAGASFRQSAYWTREFLDEEGQPNVLRSGRFGIGVFAIFLLGPCFRLYTRHAEAARSIGYTIVASAASELIEITRTDGLPVGTTIEVQLSPDSIVHLELDKERYVHRDSGGVGPSPKIGWFCWDWPRVAMRVIRGPLPEDLPQSFVAPLRKADVGPEWSLIHPPGFDGVFWTFGPHPRLVCNGLRIAKPKPWLTDATFDWPRETQLLSPKLAILDSRANLPLTTQRYSLAEDKLPFTNELTRDVSLSYIAHALICGPTSVNEACSGQRPNATHPLIISRYSTYDDSQKKMERPFSSGLLRWCSTAHAFVPADAWLCSTLRVNSFLIYGNLDVAAGNLPRIGVAPLVEAVAATHVVLQWSGIFTGERSSRAYNAAPRQLRFFTKLAESGVEALGHRVRAATLLASVNQAGFLANLLGREGSLHRTWKAVKSRNPQRQWFELNAGNNKGSISLEEMLEQIEPVAPEPIGKRWNNRERPDCCYLAKIETEEIDHHPESLIAQVWNECLGRNAIPFDESARKELVERGRQNGELKRHIEAWERMKRTKGGEVAPRDNASC